MQRGVPYPPNALITGTNAFISSAVSLSLKGNILSGVPFSVCS